MSGVLEIADGCLRAHESVCHVGIQVCFGTVGRVAAPAAATGFDRQGVTGTQFHHRLAGEQGDFTAAL